MQELLDSKEPNPYERLRAAVINRTGMTDKQRMNELFIETELGDRKPSKMLRHIRNSEGNLKIDDAFLTEM